MPKTVVMLISSNFLVFCMRVRHIPHLVLRLPTHTFKSSKGKIISFSLEYMSAKERLTNVINSVFMYVELRPYDAEKSESIFLYSAKFY